MPVFSDLRNFFIIFPGYQCLVTCLKYVSVNKLSYICQILTCIVHLAISAILRICFHLKELCL